VAHAFNPSCSGDRDQEDHGSTSAQAKRKVLSQKFPAEKRTGGVAHMVQHLPGKHEVLSSNPTKKNPFCLCTMFCMISQVCFFNLPVLFTLVFMDLILETFLNDYVFHFQSLFFSSFTNQLF
jgi:hypothetical protein